MTELKKFVMLAHVQSVKDMAFVPYGKFHLLPAQKSFRSACHSGMVSDLV